MREKTPVYYSKISKFFKLVLVSSKSLKEWDFAHVWGENSFIMSLQKESVLNLSPSRSTIFNCLENAILPIDT